MLTEPEKVTTKTEDLAYGILTSADWQQRKAGLKDGDTWTGQKAYQQAWDKIARGEGQEDDFATIGQGNEQMLAALGKMKSPEAKKIRGLIAEHGFASPEVRGVSHMLFGGHRWQRRKMQGELVAGIAFQGAMNAEEVGMQRGSEDWLASIGGELGTAELVGGIPAAQELTEKEWSGLYEVRNEMLPGMKDITFEDWRKDVESGQIGMSAEVGPVYKGQRTRQQITYSDPRFAAAARVRMNVMGQGSATRFDEQTARGAIRRMEEKGSAGLGGISLARKRAARAGTAPPAIDPSFMRGLAQKREFWVAVANEDRVATARAIKRASLEDGTGITVEAVLANLDRKIAPVNIAGDHQKGMQEAITQYNQALPDTAAKLAATMENAGGYAAAEGVRRAAVGDKLYKAYKEATTEVNVWEEAGFYKKILGNLGTTVGSKVGGRKKRRRRRRRGQERAVGFGARESAMQTINKSLRRTHSMLKTLEGRIAKLPQPSAGDGTGPNIPKPKVFGYERSR
jgi:hypothetical protein